MKKKAYQEATQEKGTIERDAGRKAAFKRPYGIQDVTLSQGEWAGEMFYKAVGAKQGTLPKFEY